MDELERFKRLARKAADDHPPPINVANQVLRRVATVERADAVTQRTLVICSVVSAVAALVVVGVTAWAWVSWTDPLDQMFTQTLTFVQ